MPHRHQFPVRGTAGTPRFLPLLVALACSPVEETGSPPEADETCARAGLQEGAPWPMRGYCPQRWSRAPQLGPEAPDLAWSHLTGGYVYASPAIGSDGTVYVGSHDGQLYALESDGTLRWTFSAGAELSSSPALGADGTVYFGAHDGQLHAVASDGTQRWSFLTDASLTSSPVVGPDGAVYVGGTTDLATEPGTSDPVGMLYALEPDGSLRWTFETHKPMLSSPSIGPDGAVYVGSGEELDGDGVGDDPWEQGQLYVVEADGTLRWSFATEAPMLSSPTVGADGTVYVGSNDHHLYAVGSDGSLAWAFETEGIVVSSAAIGPDGTIHVGSLDGSVYALTPAGRLSWSFVTGGAVLSSPAIDAEGAIYIGSFYGDALHALASDGTELWTLQLPEDAHVYASPALSAAGGLVFGALDGAVYAVGAF